ncbi:MAG: reverse gyrase [Thermofilum sp.]|jgi:reverse gyrase|nr:reverse gyrase [Thermofilum sp.]
MISEELGSIYKSMCPNCGRDISDFRLANKIPCKNCLPDESLRKLLRAKRGGELDNKHGDYFLPHLEQIIKVLDAYGTKKDLEKLYLIERRLAEFQEFFSQGLGSSPWSAQRTWARRVFMGKSFVILAPTGVGKTVFGTLMALFLSREGKKSYLILPTSVLASQVYQKAITFASKLNLNPDEILLYHGNLPKNVKENVVGRIRSNEFSILITTSQFLSRNFDKLEGKKFDFIFVDDVDSIIKSSKNIDKIFILLGFSQGDIELALEAVRESLKLGRQLRNGSASDETRALVEQLQTRIKEVVGMRKHGVLVVSTATGRPRGARIRLFRELLGFEIGSRSEFLRNLVDAFVIVDGGKIIEKTVELASRLGSGGLIFVPIGSSEDLITSLANALESAGIRVGLMHGKRKNKSALKDFEAGSVDVLIGVASYYGTLVRGLDLPHVVKYVLFVGIPHFKFSLDLSDVTPLRLIQIASNVRNVATKEDQASLDRLVVYIREALQNMEPGEYMAFTKCLAENSCTGRFTRVAGRVYLLRRIVEKYLSSPECLDRLAKETSLTVIKDGESLKLLLPDVLTYIQASGRASRLYARGISRGLSIIICDDELFLEKFKKFSRYYDIEWKSLDEIDLDQLIKEITRERHIIREILEGKIPAELKADLVKSVLVIVESPTKAKTIASFFGKPSRRRLGPITSYEVSYSGYILSIAATQGHVFDLTTQLYSYDSARDFYGVLVFKNNSQITFTPVFTTIKRCIKCGEQFTDPPLQRISLHGSLPNTPVQPTVTVCPKCGSDKILDKAEIIRALRELAMEVEEVIIATDPDTEGEKIAWDIYLSLSPYVRRIRRVEFHEVTRKAFEEALSNPRDININLVHAQLVRRIEDRWLGFSLSQALQRVYGLSWLSAGRVQTPVLGWIISNHEESLKSRKYVFRLTLKNVKNSEKLRLLIDTVRLDGKKPRAIVEEIKDARVFVREVQRSEKYVNPPPPFTTDTLLREANTILKLDVERTMKLAQDLFESGLITYHRTDSTRVSDAGLSIAKSYIGERLSPSLFTPRRWGEGGAHECIRPTRPLDVDGLMQMIRQGVLQLQITLTRDHIRLYDLIFRRFIASQMPPAKVSEATVVVSGPYFEKQFTFIKETIEEGFAKVMPIRTVFMAVEGEYIVEDATYKKVATVPLYTQADVIRLMKERNIGRPSTYSKIIKTLLDRNYVIPVKGSKLVPTRLGRDIFQYLLNNFSDVISERKTAEVLAKMDLVESGEADYVDVLKEFYIEVHEKICSKVREACPLH